MRQRNFDKNPAVLISAGLRFRRGCVFGGVAFSARKALYKLVLRFVVNITYCGEFFAQFGFVYSFAFAKVGEGGIIIAQFGVYPAEKYNWIGRRFHGFSPLRLLRAIRDAVRKLIKCRGLRS